jgi:hypothetical protein
MEATVTSGDALNDGPDSEDSSQPTDPPSHAINWNARRFLLAEREFEYKVTGNPMNVWAAWRLCRDSGNGLGLSLPAWVIAYFDSFAAQLRDWQDNGTLSDRLAEDVGNSLGFKPGSKSQNPITDWRKRVEDKAWFHVFERHLLNGASQSAAFAQTAAFVNSTEPTVRRRLNEFARSFGNTPLELVQTLRSQREADEAAMAESSHRARARYEAISNGQPDPFPPEDED